ncbi:hypothetical protein JMJ78_0006733 [Colletotrichum scovillei]|nr:hypothetical protein JMJ78_0006733 [Colletotrichum scovillei]
MSNYHEKWKALGLLRFPINSEFIPSHPHFKLWWWLLLLLWDETYSNPHSSVASRRSSSRDGRSGRRNRGSCA